MLRLWMRTHGGHCSFLLVTARATGSDHRPWLHTLSLQLVPHTLSLRPALALTDTGRAANAGMSCCSFGRSVPGPLPSPPMLHRTSLHGRDIFRQCPLVRQVCGVQSAGAGCTGSQDASPPPRSLSPRPFLGAAPRALFMAKVLGHLSPTPIAARDQDTETDRWPVSLPGGLWPSPLCMFAL